MSYNEAVNAGKALVTAFSTVAASAQEVGEAFRQLYQHLGGNGLAREALASAVSKRDANKIIEKLEEKENNLARPDTGEQKEPHEIFDSILPEIEIPRFSEEEWDELINFNIDL